MITCKCVGCEDCDGRGRVMVSVDFEADLIRCDNCRGTGVSEPCEYCLDAEDMGLMEC